MRFHCPACGTVHSSSDGPSPCDWREVLPPAFGALPGVHIQFGPTAEPHLRGRVAVVPDLDAVQTADEPPSVVG